jgi:hypothetical protein
MSPNHRSRLLVAVGFAAVLFLAAGASADSATSQRGDPLAVAQLEGSEVTLKIEDVDVVQLFRALARLGAVPFVLDFEVDPALKVSFKAQNMTLRTTLQSLADTYGLEYGTSEAGIVVRRRGMAPATKPITVGAWPSKPGPLYRLEIEARDPSGAVVRSAYSVSSRLSPGTPHQASGHCSIILPAQSLGTLKQGLPKGHDVMTFDRERLIAEPRFVGVIELRFCIKKETSAGLELLFEVVTERPLGDARYEEEHTVVSKTVGPGETLLFETQDGYQLVLKRWAREPSKRTGELGNRSGTDQWTAQSSEG